MTNQNPRGGTELQLEYLYKYVDNMTGIFLTHIGVMKNLEWLLVYQKRDA